MSTQAPDRTKFLQDLSARFAGEFRHDRMYRGLYATDASIYMQQPLAVLTPRTAAEAQEAMRAAHEAGVPVLPRAGGTSLAGQTTADGALVIDVSKHLNRLLELNKKERWAMVEPGLIRDVLNAKIAGEGLMFAPETSTSNRANIGGMIGNNSSGMMSIRYGTTIAHVLGLRALLPDGTETWFGTRAEMDITGKKLLDGLLEIVGRHRALIEERFPKVLRRVGGYSLDSFLGEDPNLANILVGAEGTLGFITQCKVRLVDKPKVILALAVHFNDIGESLRAVPLMVEHNPLSAEFMDGALIQMCLENPSTKNLMGWCQGKPEAVIPIEVDGDTTEEVIAKLVAIEKDLKEHGFGYAYSRLFTPQERHEIIEVRKAGLGVMLKAIGDAKAISFIEDACVPIEHLEEYALGIINIVAQEGMRLMTYGHASVGVLHLKPIVNLKDEADREKAARISRKAMELCKKFGGSWSGEHGDGIARGAENERFWGDEMIEVFREVKRLFDPKGIMNPGKIFDTPPVMGPLRYTGGYRKTEYRSMFHYRDAGGFQGAVEMCNGVGACRKLDSGTMCPSFMATRDERDTTRGRANALRMAMSGQMGPGALTSRELYEVLDLCLECKACKTECPSNVDMAKMKSEFLHAYHQQHGTKLRERVFAMSPRASAMNAGLLAPIVNATLGIDAVRKTINGFLGVAKERPLPKYATETFPAWFRKRTKKPGTGKQVVLFNDTYVNYHEVQIGKSAVVVLEELGFEVIAANAGCCQRPAISKGFLDHARAEGEKTLRNLDEFAQKGIPILGIEPSCTSALKGDLPDLIEDVDLGRRVSEHVLPFEDFLDREMIMGAIKVEVPNAAERYLLHGHCHQKALFGTGPLKRLLGAERVHEVDSGCCGMAGSFGYEAEHYAISQQIGESRLFPAVRAEDEKTPVIACGFSCRHQVAEATGRHPRHFIEVLAEAMGVGEKE